MAYDIPTLKDLGFQNHYQHKFDDDTIMNNIHKSINVHGRFDWKLDPETMFMGSIVTVVTLIIVLLTLVFHHLFMGQVTVWIVAAVVGVVPSILTLAFFYKIVHTFSVDYRDYKVGVKIARQRGLIPQKARRDYFDE